MNNLSDWLTLYHIAGIGPATYKLLIKHFGSPQAVLKCDAATLKDCGLNPSVIKNLQQRDPRGVERDLAWTTKNNHHHIITLEDENYPHLLREIPGDAPPLLFVKGDLSLLRSPQIAMVGSRNPSPTGREHAYHFAKTLSETGLTITSGLALGIDAASHRGALASQGPTIAVCATGLDSVYPKNHAQLAEEIIEKGGAILSEFPIGTAPKKEHFPRRNRIISGLALGTLVIEAALRSGSLITARYAADQGRDVFAIPGSIYNPLARGCHALIKQGAKLTETVEDIVEELNFLATKTSQRSRMFQESLFQPITLTGDYLKVFSELGHEPTTIDTVIRRCGLTADAVSSILMELELHRYITSTQGGYYSRER